MAQMESINVKLKTGGLVDQSFTNEHLVKILRKKSHEVKRKAASLPVRSEEFKKLRAELVWLVEGIKRYENG